MEPKHNQLPEALRRGLAAYLQANFLPARESMVKPSARQVMREPDCTPMAAPVRRKAGLRPISALRELLEKTDAGFTETLLKLIDKTGKKDSEIYTRANLSRQHFSKIRNNPDYRPSKATALALAIALELDLQQTRDLIGRAGYALTKSSKFDLIVMYFIEQGHYDLDDINAALYEYDQSLLGM